MILDDPKIEYTGTSFSQGAIPFANSDGLFRQSSALNFSSSVDTLTLTKSFDSGFSYTENLIISNPYTGVVQRSSVLFNNDLGYIGDIFASSSDNSFANLRDALSVNSTKLQIIGSTKVNITNSATGTDNLVVTGDDIYFSNFSANRIPFFGSSGLVDSDDSLQHFTGTDILTRIWNQGTSAGQDTRYQAVTEPTGGDPMTLYTINGVIDWSIGIDNNDSDILKFSKSSTVGTNTYFQIDQAGQLYYPIATDNAILFKNTNDIIAFTSAFTYDSNTNILGVGESSPTATVHIRPELATSDFTTNGILVDNPSNAGTNAQAIIAAQVGGSSAGDPKFVWNVAGVGGWSAGIDNSAGDIFVIANSNTDLATNNYFAISPGGDISFSNEFIFDVSEPQFRIGTTSLGTFDGISMGNAADMDLRIGQGSSNNVILGWKYNATTANAYAILETFGGNNDLLLQSAGGNVGINVTSASRPLSVKANSLGYITDWVDYATGNTRWHFKLQGTSNADFGFSETGVSDNRLVLKAGGYVGINEATPADTLVLGGTNPTVFVKGSGNLYINNNTTSSTYFRFHQNSAIPLSVIDSSSALNFRFGSGAGTNTVQMSSSGMTMFSSALDANQVFQLPNSSSQQAKSNAWNLYSDVRLKEQIVDMPSVRDSLMLFKPVRGRYKGKFEGYKYIEPSEIQDFFLAQDMAEIMPWLCTYDEEGIANGLDYSKTIPRIVKGWQEHEEDIITLKLQVQQILTQLGI